MPTCTIPAGESLSSALDLSAGTASFIHMPAQWTPANITFQISPDNVVYTDVVDEDAREFTMAVTPNTTIRLTDHQSAAYGWLKIRSGPRIAPVPQAANRVITISGITGT